LCDIEAAPLPVFTGVALTVLLVMDKPPKCYSLKWPGIDTAEQYGITGQKNVSSTLMYPAGRQTTRGLLTYLHVCIDVCRQLSYFLVSGIIYHFLCEEHHWKSSYSYSIRVEKCQVQIKVIY
jgi:hypothetical protein